MVGFDRHAIAGIRDRHRRDPPEDVAEAALVRRIKVLDEYDGKARIRRQTLKEEPECLQPAGGSINANH